MPTGDRCRSVAPSTPAAPERPRAEIAVPARQILLDRYAIAFLHTPPLPGDAPDRGDETDVLVAEDPRAEILVVQADVSPADASGFHVQDAVLRLTESAAPSAVCPS